MVEESLMVTFADSGRTLDDPGARDVWLLLSIQIQLFLL